MTRAEAFLQALAASRNLLDAARIALVVAHPDDETIALGAQLPRLPGLAIVHVTDGAPRGGGAAEAHGFATPADYAAARRRELKAAMALAGIASAQCLDFGIPDQEASLDLAGLARRLAALLADRAIDLVVTHAFEGGHPDHDATAFAVHAAARLLGEDGAAIVEAPFYHLGADGWATQRFAPGSGPPETTLTLLAAQQDLKRRMLAAHASQARVLGLMSVEVERCRPAPAYDFTKAPNGGRVLYDGFGWGMTGARWRALAVAALRELGAGTAP